MGLQTLFDSSGLDNPQEKGMAPPLGLEQWPPPSALSLWPEPGAQKSLDPWASDALNMGGAPTAALQTLWPELVAHQGLMTPQALDPWSNTTINQGNTSGFDPMNPWPS